MWLWWDASRSARETGLGMALCGTCFWTDDVNTKTAKEKWKIWKLRPLCCLEFRQIDSQEHSFVLGHETASKLSLSQSAGAPQFPAPATCSDEGSDLHDPGRWVGNPEKKRDYGPTRSVLKEWTDNEPFIFWVEIDGFQHISTLALASS